MTDTGHGQLARLVHRLLDWFYPPHCYHCSKPLAGSENRILCGSCHQWLAKTRIGPRRCCICGFPLPGSSGQEQCINCRLLQPHFSRARAIFSYTGPAATLVQSYKYQGNYFLGPRLLNLSIAHGWFPKDMGDFDCVIPVPLHPRRRRQRGYNQATLLARQLTGSLEKPLLQKALRRTRDTGQQALLSRPKRRENVRGAFAPGRQSVSGRRVLLVDDVMTTGATAGECAKVLKKEGAHAVMVFTLVAAVK